MGKVKVLIEIDEERYLSYRAIDKIGNANKAMSYIARGKVLPKTRKEVHKTLFGIDPPELGSPYCSCADGGDGCEFCRHKEDQNCDVQWWNAEMPMSAANQATDMRKEQK